jgi:hypothetical protein
LIVVVEALVKTCSPSFHEKGISGADEMHMRWEFCTKMTFSPSATAKWETWGLYRHPDYFQKLWMNHLIEYKADGKKADPLKTLIKVNLLIYDEIQW